ncbi:hypothetical protein, partial [Phocaeicola sp.]|uniref:hypothetical protein n=1 Tax=Phocaeicola sp. TaxID=2773926 RepID=UPI003A95ADF2
FILSPKTVIYSSCSNFLYLKAVIFQHNLSVDTPPKTEKHGQKPIFIPFEMKTPHFSPPESLLLFA